jgi:peroxin-5
MSLRQLVTGNDMCTASDGAGPSNAVGALVDQLLGGASKTQEQLRDVSAAGECSDVGPRYSPTPDTFGISLQLPVHQGPAVPGHVTLDPAAAAAAAAAGPRIQLPGLPQSAGDMVRGFRLSRHSKALNKDKP